MKPLIELVARWLAYAGGVVLTGVMLMSVASIVPRALGFQPIQGDFELVQVAGAVCVACFLPWSHLKGGNIIVDFFTNKCSDATNARFDAFGAWLLAATLALLCWRSGAGMLSVKDGNETSMIMGVPIWLGYAGMLPGLAWTAVAAAYTGWESWNESNYPGTRRETTA